MTFPSFSVGETLRAADMNAVGLWLVKSQTVGAGVGSVTITNCFNADFRNYRVTFEGGTQSGNNLATQLQFAGGAGHYASMRYDPFNGVGAGVLPTFNQTFCYFGLTGTQNQATFVMDVFAPFTTEWTKYTGSFTGDNFAGTGSGVNASNTSLTGFTLVWPGATNTGGIVKVYGYRN
jgi:hypothetical protein